MTDPTFNLETIRDAVIRDHLQDTDGPAGHTAEAYNDGVMDAAYALVERILKGPTIMVAHMILDAENKRILEAAKKPRQADTPTPERL